MRIFRAVSWTCAIVAALALLVSAPACSDSVTGAGDLPPAAADTGATAEADEGTDTGGGDSPQEDPGPAAPSDVGEAADHATDTTPAAPAPKRTPGGLLLELPFVLEREDVGEPLSDEEIATFTRRVTGLLEQVDYFTWLYEVNHGTDASTGLPDYLIFWHDVEAHKSGDLVTFVNNKEDGGSHNNAVPTMLALAQVIGGYLNHPEPASARILEQLARSIHAVTLGMVYDEDDPVDFLMARNIITQNHSFTLPSGKKKAVDYTEWFFSYEGWNAERFRYESNPTWGDIWVTNMRSKDDVPYFFRVAAWLPYVIELAPDPEVREVAEEALDLLTRFSKDIVDHDWNIRTKDKDGNAYVVTGEDLGSLAAWVKAFPDAECDARLGAALAGYGEPKGVDCADGQGSPYDVIAGNGNYFNYDIIVHFHIAAAALALVKDQDEVAKKLVEGLITRFERYRDPETTEPGRTAGEWDKEISNWLIMSASVGYPLTSDEARHIHRFYTTMVAEFEVFERWDLWDPSVPDGVYNFRDGGMYPKHENHRIDVEYMAFVLELCWSPFLNPAGARFVDCEVVRDPSRWGE